MTTTAVDDLANVPHPAGATTVYDWEDVPSAPSRFFVGSSWLVERDGEDDVSVVINGTQWPDRTEYASRSKTPSAMCSRRCPPSRPASSGWR